MTYRMREFVNKNLFLIIIVLGFLFLLSLPNKAYAQAPLCRAAPGQRETYYTHIAQCGCNTEYQSYICNNTSGQCSFSANFQGANPSCGNPNCKRGPVRPFGQEECLQGGSGCTPTCQNCTKTCNTGERLDSTTCVPRATSCTKKNSCTGEDCGTTNYSCYPIGTCQDCTPIPPSGYHLPQPGEITICTKATARCNKTTNCGVACGEQTAEAYQDETNTTPNPPQDLQITIDEVNSGNLSTVASSPPTLIKYPYPSSAISTFIRNVTSAPAGSREFGWELRIGSTLITPRKVFNTAPPFNVYGPYPSASSLFQGYNGVYHARYYTLNKCDNIEKYSTSLDGYFRVNTLPTSTGTIVGEANPGYKGCVPEANHTGKNVNRTLTVTVSGTDPDDTNSINGAILWLVKDGSNITSEKGLMTFVGPSNARVDINKIGLFINSGGTVYISDNSTGTLTGWGRNGRDGGTIPHPVTDGNDVTIIDNVQLVRHGMNLLNGRYEYEITLAFPESSPLTGHYTLYTGMTDTLSYVRDNLGRTSIDQRAVSSTDADWNFDFVNPTITNTDIDIDSDTRILDLTWNSDDVGSGIRLNHTIVNAYKEEIPRNDVTWVNVTPNQPITPSDPPDAEQVGNYNVVSGWRFPSSGINNLMKISTGENSNGTLYLYITAYDKACNVGQSGDDLGNPPLEINLNKWVNTKGGVFYSKGIVAYATKPIEDDFYNLGTELISSNSNSIGLVLIYTPPKLHVNPAVAKGILDINNNSGQYAKLKENFERKKGSLPSAAVIGGTVTCSFDTGCIWEIPSPASTIGNTSYSGKIIAYSNSDITITGEIKNNAAGANTNKDGLIIFSEGTITIIGETKTHSGTLETDIIHAWLLAKNNVILAPGDTEAPYYYHDQVYITGGIVAFGEEASSPAFQLKRTLGLFNISDPVLKVDYHPKYSSISGLFFGLHSPAYKREVGFKPM